MNPAPVFSMATPLDLGLYATIPMTYETRSILEIDGNDCGLKGIELKEVV